jgi:hypothetical protein
MAGSWVIEFSPNVVEAADRALLQYVDELEEFGKSSSRYREEFKKTKSKYSPKLLSQFSQSIKI